MDTDRIEKQILLRAPFARVWRAITDSGEFGTWFGMKFDQAFLPGAVLRGTMTPTKVNAEVAAAQERYEGMSIEIHIERMVAERIFAFRWHPFAIDTNADYSAEPMTLIEFTLEEVGDGVLLKVTETGFDKIPLARRANAFSANESGWSVVVELIEAYLAQFE